MISLEEAATTNPQPSTKGGQNCDATASKICQYCNAILDSFPDLIHHIKAQHIGWHPCEDAAENDLWAEELLEKLRKKRNKFDNSNKEAKGLLVMVAHSHTQDLTRWIVLPNQKHSDPQEKKKDPAIDSNQWPPIPEDGASPDSCHVSQKNQTHILKDKVYTNSKQPCVNSEARVRKHKLVKDENDDGSKLGVQIKFKRWCGEAEICDKSNQATSNVASGDSNSGGQSSSQSVLGLHCSQVVSKPAAIVQPLSASPVKPPAVSLNSSKIPPKSDEVVTKVSFFTLEGAGGTHVYYFCHHCSQVFKSHSDFKRHSEEVKARSRNDPIQGTPSPKQSIKHIKPKPSPLGTQQTDNFGNVQDGSRQLSKSVHNSERTSNITHSKSSSKKHKRSLETRAESRSSVKKKKKKKKKHHKHRHSCKCALLHAEGELCKHSKCPDTQSSNSVEPNHTSVVSQSSNPWSTIFPVSLTGQNSQATPQAAKFQYLPVSRELMALPQTSQFGFAHFTMPQQATQLGSTSTAMPQVSQLGSTYLTRPHYITFQSDLSHQDNTQLIYSTNVPVQKSARFGTVSQQITQHGSNNLPIAQSAQPASINVSRPQPTHLDYTRATFQQSAQRDVTNMIKPQSAQLNSTNVQPKPKATQIDYTSATFQQSAQLGATNVMKPQSTQLDSTNVSKPKTTQLDYTSATTQLDYTSKTFQQSAQLETTNVMKPQSTQLNSTNVTKPKATQLDYTSATFQQSAQLGTTNVMKPQSTQLNSTNVPKPQPTQLDYTSATFQQSAQLGATNVMKPQSTQLDSTNLPKPQPTQLLYTSATFKQSAQLDSTNVSKPHATELCSTNAHSAPLGNTTASKTKGTDLWSANATKPQIASLDSVNVSKQPSNQPCLNSVSSAQDTQPNSPNVTRPVSSATKQQASKVGSADATKLQGVHLSLSNITDPQTSQPVIIKLAKQQAVQLGLTSATMPQASNIGSANVPKLQRVPLSSSNITKSQDTPPVTINATKQQATQVGSTSATMPKASEEVSAYYPKLQGVRLSSSKPRATPPVFFNVTKQQATQLGFTYATMPQASKVGSDNVTKLQRVRLSSSNITKPQATPSVTVNATKQQATQVGSTSATMPQASKVGSANVTKLQGVKLTQVGSINVAKPQVAQLDTANVREQKQTIQHCVNSVKRAQGPQPNPTNDTRFVSSAPKSQASVNVAKLRGVQFLRSISFTKPQMTQLGSSNVIKQQSTQLSSNIVKKSHVVGLSSSNVTKPQVAQQESIGVKKMQDVQLSSTNVTMQQATQQGSNNVIGQQATQLGSTNVTMPQTVQPGPTNKAKPKATQHDSINLTQYALAALQSNKQVARPCYTNVPILQGVQLMTLREASQQGSTNVTGPQATQPGSTNVTMPQSVRLDFTNKAKPKATRLGSIDLTKPQDAGPGYTNVTKLQSVQRSSFNMTMTQTSQQVSTNAVKSQSTQHGATNLAKPLSAQQGSTIMRKPQSSQIGSSANITETQVVQVSSSNATKPLSTQPSSASVKILQSTQLHSRNMTKSWDAELCSSVTKPLVAQLDSNSVDVTKSQTTQSRSTNVTQLDSTNVTKPHVSNLTSTNVTKPKAMQLGFSNVTLMSLPTESTGIKHSNIDTVTAECTKLAKSKSAMATTTLLGSTTMVKPQSTTLHGSPAAVPKASQSDYDSFRTQFEIDFPTRTTQSSGQFAPTKTKASQSDYDSFRTQFEIDFPTRTTQSSGQFAPTKTKASQSDYDSFRTQFEIDFPTRTTQSSGQFAPTKGKLPQKTGPATGPGSPLTNIQQFTPQLKVHMVGASPQSTQAAPTQSTQGANVASSPKYFQIVTKPPVPQSETTKSNSETGKEMQNSGGQNTINKTVKMKDPATKDAAGCPDDEQNMFPCPHCFSSFQNPFALKLHMSFDHYELSLIRCWHCSAKYSDKWSLESHILEKHKVCCRYCPKMISQSWQKPFQPFGEEASIELHEKIKHGKIYVPRSRSRQRQKAMYMAPLCSKKTLTTSHTETKVPSDTAEKESDGRGDVNRNNNSASQDTSSQVVFVVQGDKVTVKKTPNAYRSKTSQSDSIENGSQVKVSSSTQLNPTANLPLPVSTLKVAPSKFVIKRVGPNNHIIGQRTSFHKRPHQPGLPADAVQSNSQISEDRISSGSTEEDGDVILIEPTSSTDILEHMQRTMAQKNIPLSVKAKIANFLLEKISKIHKEEAEMTRRNKTGVFSCQYCNKKFLSFQPVKYHEAMHETKDMMNSSLL